MKKTLLEAKEGDRIRAKIRVYDLPGENFGPPDAEVKAKWPQADTIHAEPGEEGVVVYTEPGVFPTATFIRTGTSTMVCDHEAELIGGEGNDANEGTLH